MRSIREEVRARVCALLRGHVSGQLWYQPYDPPRDQLRCQLWDQAREGLWYSLIDHVGPLREPVVSQLQDLTKGSK